MELINPQSATLDMMEEFIRGRKIAKLKKCYTEERHFRQIDFMFYYSIPDGKYWKKKANVAIVVYRDDTYVVVRAIRGYKPYYNEYYHSVWVLGIDNKIPWLHRLEWSKIFEDPKQKYDKELIRKLMRFDKDIDEQEQESTKFTAGIDVRIQGDLLTTKIENIDTYVMKYSEQLKKLRDDFEEDFEKQALEEGKDDPKLLEIQKDVVRLYEAVDSKNYASDIMKLSKELKAKYKLDYVNQGSLDREKGYIERGIVARAKDKYHYNGMIRKFLVPHIQEIIRKANKSATQVNLRLGNHLIIIEKGLRTRDTPESQLFVMEKTLVHFIHDEHENRTIRIDPGSYRFHLLIRHITDGSIRRR